MNQNVNSHRRTALLVLMSVGLFNFIDRLCMSILSVPIRRELGLTDTEIGILTGLAFSLVYTLTALPIARIADGGSRKRVIVVCLALWSLMTALCGWATGFLMLAVLRMGVALGEAGCVPATHALLSDYYPREDRARALATWQLVFPVGTLIGFAASGWLSEEIGWRQTFIALGVAGLMMAPFVQFRLNEPVRTSKAGSHPISLFRALRTLWSLRTYRYAVLGGAFMAYPLNAALYWNGQVYSRLYGMPLAELSVWLALLSGVVGAIGLYGGGWLADRVGRHDPRWQMWVPGIAGLLVAPFMFAQYFATDASWSLLIGIVPTALLNAFMPPQAAAGQSLASPSLRAMASGTIVLVSGTMGTAVGPFLTGYLSESLSVGYGLGPDGLRWAVAGSGVLAAVGGLFFIAAGRHYAADLKTPATLG